ncbi:hypothetical protein KFL_000330375 [Klebsormidium nitens]|uniref:Uncharacterized protein n=1 Tax=Klebsormidium nitens TaxID=105231 RepID=A0A1Y1HRH6_KLENI|nr:hypothetical protein KFL_000330375 [Klebsormidium nitens]|eukprot:GAQ79591.1 hypothetical protein KFL_000330375 [Klebsormidium nitens]
MVALLPLPPTAVLKPERDPVTPASPGGGAGQEPSSAPTADGSSGDGHVTAPAPSPGASQGEHQTDRDTPFQAGGQPQAAGKRNVVERGVEPCPPSLAGGSDLAGCARALRRSSRLGDGLGVGGAVPAVRRGGPPSTQEKETRVQCATGGQHSESAAPTGSGSILNRFSRGERSRRISSASKFDATGLESARRGEEQIESEDGVEGGSGDEDGKQDSGGKEAGQAGLALGVVRGRQDGRVRAGQGRRPGGKQAGGALRPQKTAQDDGKAGDIQFVPGKRVARHEATLDYDTVLGRLTLVKHWEQPERQTDSVSRTRLRSFSNCAFETLLMAPQEERQQAFEERTMAFAWGQVPVGTL